VSFFLNFFWEVTHTYFYTFRDSAFDTLLYGWIHCAWVDVMITLGCFWVVCLLNLSRRWFLELSKLNLACFITAGVVYTFISEWVNVQILESWSYNEMMPAIPPIGVGLTPILQWIVVPSVTILLVRYHLLFDRQAAKAGCTEGLFTSVPGEEKVTATDPMDLPWRKTS